MLTVDGGADPRQFGRQVIEHLRQMLLVKMAGDDMIDVTAERRAVLRQQAEAIGRKALLAAMRAFNAARARLAGRLAAAASAGTGVFRESEARRRQRA